MHNECGDDSLRRRLVQLTHLYFRETFQELKKIRDSSKTSAFYDSSK